MITLHVNGQARSVQATPDTPLLYVLRNELGLLAAKLGCGAEQCGSCTVLVNGEARTSCRLPIASLADAEVTTLEGIGTPETPHPLQRAFIAENAAQCGYCTSGILVAAKALLDRKARPTRVEVQHALRDNLCRCGSHNRVLRAVERAARELSATGGEKP